MSTLHLTPVKPASQLQVKSLTLSMQVPKTNSSITLSMYYKFLIKFGLLCKYLSTKSSAVLSQTIFIGIVYINQNFVYNK